MLCTCFEHFSVSSRNSYAEPAFLRSVGLMVTLWIFLKHHISTQNEGKDFLASSIFQDFLRDWGHAGGMLGASFLRVWACFRALKLLTS